uniref:Uncharacterized protein n=1 Tax=Phlebotomus papatasi TaxID=29031 RepID=A0A1B0EXF0_PHLPP
LFLVIGTVSSVPSDVELLNGYNLTPLGGFLLSPEDDTFMESQSLIGHKLVKAIRSKRSPYKVLESPGLRSHFRLSHTSYIPEEPLEASSRSNSKDPPRKRRELESEAIEDSVEMIDRAPRGTSGEKTKSTEVEMPPDVEELPRPEKQIMEPGYYRQGRRLFEDDLEDDSVAEASAINDGIKARAPRGYADTYDKYRMPDYYEPWRRMRFYDSYSSRNLMPPPPYAAYSSYPEHRFESPPTAVDMRGYPVYPTPYVNDVTYAPPLPRPPHVRNRRIIYYANLPEVVRSPPNVELRYRYNSDYYPAMETYRNFRHREYSKVDNSTPQPAAKLQEQKGQDDGKIEYTRNANVKVISGLRIQNHQQQPPDYRKYVDETKINDFPVRY